MKCEAFEYNCLEGHPPCIHTSMICDGAPHCMINDDEKTCGEKRSNIVYRAKSWYVAVRTSFLLFLNFSALTGSCLASFAKHLSQIFSHYLKN